MKNTQIYTYTIPANGSVQILTEGTYFRILSATGTLEVDADTYGNIQVMAGQGVKDQPFKRLFLNDKSGANNLVSLVVSDGSFVDDRINGDVSVIDGGKNRSISNGAYSQWVNVSALAGNYSYCQLWNPSGSGQYCIVEKILMASQVATGYLHQFNTAAAAVLHPLQGKSKLLNAAPSTVAQLRTGQVAAYPGTNYWLSNGPINSQVDYSPAAPVIISPGVGLCIVSQLLAADVSASFEWFEESIL